MCITRNRLATLHVLGLSRPWKGRVYDQGVKRKREIRLFVVVFKDGVSVLVWSSLCRPG